MDIDTEAVLQAAGLGAHAGRCGRPVLRSCRLRRTRLAGRGPHPRAVLSHLVDLARGHGAGRSHAACQRAAHHDCFRGVGDVGDSAVAA